MVIAPPRQKAALLALVVASALAAIDAPAQTNPAPQQAQLDKNAALILIRGALLAVDQANKTGNYTVLRDLGAQGFQAVNTAARLSEIFASLRRDKVDLSGVAVLEPQLSTLPVIEPNGMMRMVGFFPSVPTQIKFELLFAPEQGQWRLFGISVSLASATPAPQPNAAPVATQPKKPAPAPAGH